MQYELEEAVSAACIHQIFSYMKKIFLSCALLSIVSLNAYSQISAGTVSIGGALNYARSSTKNEIPPTAIGINSNYTTSSLNIQPIVGYFISDNISVGINTSVSFGKSKQDESGRFADSNQDYKRNNSRKERIVSLGPIARYYKFIGDKFALFGQFGAGYKNNYFSEYNNYSNSIYSYSGRSQGFYANLSPGLTFFPTKKLGIELSVNGLSYDHITQKKDGFKWSNSSLYTNFGLSSLFIGGSIYLGRS